MEEEDDVCVWLNTIVLVHMQAIAQSRVLREHAAYLGEVGGAQRPAKQQRLRNCTTRPGTGSEHGDVVSGLGRDRRGGSPSPAPCRHPQGVYMGRLAQCTVLPQVSGLQRAMSKTSFRAWRHRKLS